MEITSSQQIKPYPRYLYHRDHDEPKIAMSKAEESELSTKGWLTTYVHKEYPKYVGDKIVNSQEEEERLLAERNPLPEVALDAIEQGPANIEEIPFMTSNGQDLEVVKEIQVDGVDTAAVEKPKRGRPKK